MDAPEAMHSTEADHVTVLGRRLLLKDGRLDNVKLANGRRHTFKKNNTETLHAFEARVNKAAAQESDAAASSGAMASVSTRDGTPSNTRPLREPGAVTKGKPSWDQSPGQGSMPPPSPRKRGKQREASSTRPQPCFESDAKFHPWEFPGLGLGAAQHVGGAAPNFGLTQGYLGSASAPKPAAACGSCSGGGSSCGAQCMEAARAAAYAPRPSCGRGHHSGVRVTAHRAGCGRAIAAVAWQDAC
jgi:hypothetical protein